MMNLLDLSPAPPRCGERGREVVECIVPQGRAIVKQLSVASEGAVHVIGQGVKNIGEPQASEEKAEELGVNGKRPQRIKGIAHTLK
jgi:hypothetical protein